MEYILIGIGGAILLGILILGFCIICVCCVRYRRRPKIYSPTKGLVIQYACMHTCAYTRRHTYCIICVCCVRYRRHPKSYSPTKGLVIQCTHTCIHTHTYMHTHTCAYTHPRTYTHIHIRTYTHTRTHAHTQWDNNSIMLLYQLCLHTSHII